MILGCLIVPSPSASKENHPQACSSSACLKEEQRGLHVRHWLPELGISVESADGLLSPGQKEKLDVMWLQILCMAFYQSLL